MKWYRAEQARFVAAGAVNTVLSYILYVVLFQVIAYRAAFTLAYVAGIVSSYFLNARFVFRRAPTWRTVARFPLVYVVQYASSLVLVTAAVQWLAIPEWAAPLAALVVVVPITYVLSRLVFSDGNPP